MKSFRKIVSLTLGISFLIMSYTGIMLFLAPHGRVAYWSNWRLLGLTKDQYGDIHTTSMVIFLLFGILHIYFNWNSILNYLRDKARNISFTKKEFIIALLINFTFLIGTILNLQPFQGFLNFEENIKAHWARIYGEPPYGHAEETRLDIFCNRMGIPLEKAKNLLKAKGIKFSPEESLKKIAQQNHITPGQLYNIISPSSSGALPREIPSRLGKRTLQELGEMGKIDLQKALSLLQKKGIKNPSPQMTIRDLANIMGTTPKKTYYLLQENK